ncbi:arrestin homolog, partial [Limulus polyphemus]|uniref:Arrestin homolog n=1 Tax=Limulus polyphemus TaxID=6850 RepID=A0ABM1C0Q1_LIMPO
SRPDEKPHKRSTVRMSLRCVHYFPAQPFNPLAPPSASVCKTFVFSPGKLELETVLDREIYHHGDIMHVHVTVNNNSNKTVQKIKVYAIQYVYVCMFTNGRFKNLVGLAETEDGHPVSPGASLSRDFCFKLMSFLKYPVALALEGGFNDDVTVLATSSLNPRPKEKNPYGVIVTYRVKVKAVLGCMDRPVIIHLPFKILSYRTADDFTFSTRPKQQRAFATEIVDDEDSATEEISRLLKGHAGHGQCFYGKSNGPKVSFLYSRRVMDLENKTNDRRSPIPGSRGYIKTLSGRPGDLHDVI